MVFLFLWKEMEAPGSDEIMVLGCLQGDIKQDFHKAALCKWSPTSWSLGTCFVTSQHCLVSIKIQTIQISCDLDSLCRRTNDFSPAVEFMAPHQKAHDINTAAALFIENSGVALWWMFCMQFISHMWRVCTGFIL